MAYTPPEDLGEKTLEQTVTEYRESRGLNENNFSLSYYNTVTGESYAYNDEAFMVAASTYKLPLNMYYYEMEQEGLIASDAYIPGAGCTLDVCHEQSLVWSNNEVSIGMLYHMGNFRTYKENMRKFFTMTDEEIDSIYYADNHYCTRMMMDALKYLYLRQERFGPMLDYMKQAQPEQWFRTYVRDYEVAHKYGYFEGAINDVGIIYTPEPILLAVYTFGTAETVVAETAALMTAYAVAHVQLEPEPEQEAEEGPAGTELHLQVEFLPREEEAEQEPEVLPEPEDEPEVFEWWMAAVALGVFLLGGGLTVLLTRPARIRKKYEQKYTDRIKMNK